MTEVTTSNDRGEGDEGGPESKEGTTKGNTGGMSRVCRPSLRKIYYLKKMN